jgi:hypothetical protein
MLYNNLVAAKRASLHYQLVWQRVKSLMRLFHTRPNKRDRLFCVFLDRFWTQAVNIWSEMFPVIMDRD